VDFPLQESHLIVALIVNFRNAEEARVTGDRRGHGSLFTREFALVGTNGESAKFGMA